LEVAPPETEDTSPPLPGELEVDPSAVATTGCVDVAATITLSNVGESDLTINALEMEGEGVWTLEAPILPLVLTPAESVEVPVLGQLGHGVLVVESDDPVRPRVLVPLSTVEDDPPVVEIVSPTHNSIIDVGNDLDLVGQVEDDSDVPESLTLAWESSVDGALGSPVADASGRASTLWASAVRSDGPHNLTFSASDSCGNTNSADITLCQQAGYTSDEYDIANWHFEGSATWDSTNSWLQLTHVANNLVGSAFETSNPVSGDAVSIRFRFFIGSGSGADGLSLTALDTGRMGGFLGGTGCGIGYGGDAVCTGGPALPGWSIEVDTYHNEEADPTEEDHLALTFDGDVDNPAAWAALPEMEDTGWHTMEVTVVAPNVHIEIDGVVYISDKLSGHFSFPAYIGFTAGTGGATNEHLIDALEVEGVICE